MIENIQDLLEKVTLFDYIYLVLTALLMIRGAIKGFVLSILSAAKWVLAYILTIYIFPKVKPCLLYTSPSPRDQRGSRMPSSAWKKKK